MLLGYRAIAEALLGELAVRIHPLDASAETVLLQLCAAAVAMAVVYLWGKPILLMRTVVLGHRRP